MKIYGDTNSGNCLKVKWVCDHLALPYTWIAVDTVKGETRTTEFLKLNNAGQVPTVAFDDGRTLAQSNAIIRTVHKPTVRSRRREDVGPIVAMLADDPLGGARERIEDPLPQSYFTAFETLQRDPNILLVVADDGEGAVVGCLQLCILPGLSSQGASRGLIEDVRVAKHCRSRGIGEQMSQWAVAEARARGCKLVELLTHHTRVDAQRFYERLGFARGHVGMTVRF